MPYGVKYLEEDKIVLIDNEGKLNLDDYQQQAKESSRMAREKQVCRFLVDDTKLDNQASFFQVNDLPNIYARIGFDAATKMAVVKSKIISKASTDVDFFATVCKRRGYLMKLFFNKREAIAWLKAD